MVAAIDGEFGLAPGAEVTTESNPDSVTPADLEELRAGGLNRVSFGMQSAVGHVLRTLDRTHDPRAGARRGRVGPRRPASTGRGGSSAST